MAANPLQPINQRVDNLVDQLDFTLEALENNVNIVDALRQEAAAEKAARIALEQRVIVLEQAREQPPAIQPGNLNRQNQAVLPQVILPPPAPAPAPFTQEEKARFFADIRNVVFTFEQIGYCNEIRAKLNKNLSDDKNTMLAAVQINGLAISYASPRLKNDRDIALAAVQHDGFALSSIRNQFGNDREIVLAAIARGSPRSPGSSILQYASDDLKNDREVVLAAVRGTFWEELRYASDDLRDDKEIVLAAVRRCGTNLKYASDRLKDDKEVVLAACRQPKNVLEYASKRLQSDADVRRHSSQYCVIV